MRNLGKVVLYSREDICELFGLGPEKAQTLFYNDEFPAVKVRKRMEC